MSFLDSPGELPALIRARRWEETSLGPIASWPQALQIVLRIMLTSRYAMWMGWGPDLAFFYNDAYARMTLGAKHPWALGRPSREVWAEIWPQIGPRIEHVLATGEATWDEGLLLFLERSGYREETYHTFSYSPLADDGGVICGHMCIVTEETNRILGERRLAFLKELASQLISAKTMDDVFAGIARCLETDSRDMPFTLSFITDERDEARLAGATNVARDHAGASAKLWPLARAMSEAVIVDLAPEIEWPRGPWSDPPRQAAVIPIIDHARTVGILVAALSPYRALDDAYQSFLNLFVGQIAAGLANAHAYEEERRRAEALAEIDRTKTAFFSNVSHEFRTPLTLMLGQTEDALASPSRALAGEALESVHRNELRLLKLVNALLDFARMEANRVRPQFEPTDLGMLTRDLASTFRAAVERATLRFDVDAPEAPAPVLVDRDMWEKIVFNLLSNALKFTFDGTISVGLRFDEKNVVLTVRDTGTGIPEAELPRIFDRFHRVQGGRARSHEGSGIGLALVKELATVHGGDVAVTSEVDKGTTFVVSIPRVREHVETDAPSVEHRARAGYVEEASRWLVAPRNEQSSDGPTILLADDNADMREYVARVLGTRFRVHAVANGREALEAALRDPPALVLTDVMMPELDGFGLLAKLREDPKTRGIPVIMLSARAGEEARVSGVESGADDYIVKPFSARELLARVTLHVQLGQLRLTAEAERENAVAASRAKDEFLAMLGHELRNPLAPMLTALQLLRLQGKSSREHDILERQVGHLTRLVDDLLDVSRITRGKIELRKRPTDIADVIGRAVEISSPLLEQRRHRLELNVMRGIVADLDRDRMAQVVANLLTNAAKYSDAGSRIRVTAARVDGSARITVEDEGVGIEPAMQARIFEIFVQRPQTIERSQGGLGLGLAIVKSLTELHGGTVSLESDGVRRGSAFSIDLPAIDTPTSHADTLAATTSNDVKAQRGRILVVDDNMDAAEMLGYALEQLGYHVESAHDGPRALDIAKAFNPSIALVDIGLPVMNGYELAPRLRALLPDVHLVAVTGYGQEEDRKRSRDAGFEDHLVKPVDLTKLEALLQKPRA